MTLENNIKLPLIGDRMFPSATGGTLSLRVDNRTRRELAEP